MERQIKLETRINNHYKAKRTNYNSSKQMNTEKNLKQGNKINFETKEATKNKQLKHNSNQTSEQQRSKVSKSKECEKPLPVIFASAPLQSNFVQVSILGKTINTLVDTGSSLSCIQKSLLNTIDQDFVIYGSSEYRKVKGIGGNLISISGTAILPVRIGNQLFHQKFYIFEEILHPLLLGIDFLKANNCTLNFEHQTLDSDTGTPVINLLGVNTVLGTGLARPLKHTVIHPHSETVIPIRISRIPHQETALFEPANLLTRKKLAGAKSILNVHNGRGFCRILNPLSSPVTLGPSNVIGKLCPIHTDSIVELDLETKDTEPSVNSATSSDTINNEDSKAKYKKFKEIVDDLGISLEESDLSETQKLK